MPIDDRVTALNDALDAGISMGRSAALARVRERVEGLARVYGIGYNVPPVESGSAAATATDYLDRAAVLAIIEEEEKKIEQG